MQKQERIKYRSLLIVYQTVIDGGKVAINPIYKARITVYIVNMFIYRCESLY